jgi:hypothetical protein
MRSGDDVLIILRSLLDAGSKWASRIFAGTGEMVPFFILASPETLQARFCNKFLQTKNIKTMETRHTKTNNSYSDFDDSFENFTETTNPFPNRSFSTEKHPASSGSGNLTTAGKRPRIYKPLYSVRLS